MLRMYNCRYLSLDMQYGHDKNKNVVKITDQPFNSRLFPEE